MAFLYVDRITDYQPRRRILGIKNITRSEPYLFPGPDGKRIAHPSLLIEAFAQLSAWLAILDHGFEKRPLFLGEDRAELPAPVLSGDQVKLDVELIRYSDDVVETRGTATVNGRTVFRSECGRGYLVPMAGFDDPVKVEKRFKELHRPGLKQGREVTALPDSSHAAFWQISRKPLWDFVDGVRNFTPLKEAETFKTVSVAEPFFDEHFPRRPIVPGVMLMSMVLDAAEMLVRAEPETLGAHRFLTLKEVLNVRFRKIVEPGDQCIVKARAKAWDATTRQLRVTAAVYVGTGRVAQVEMVLSARAALPAEGPRRDQGGAEVSAV